MKVVKMKNKIIIGVCTLAVVIAIVLGFIMLGNKTYSVSFNSNGGSNISMQKIKKGDKVNKPTDPTKDGYTFVNWEYQNTEYDFNSPVESNLTLNAIWEEVPQVPKYKITFTVDNQTKTIEVSDISEIDLDNLEFEDKVGYILKWYVNGKEYKFTEALTSDLSVEGKYEKTASYTVKFNSNGGNSIANQTVKVGGKATQPTNVKKEGYILDGWYLNNTKYDFNSEVNKNITLVAKWTEDPNVKRYEVKFNSDGGSSVSSQRIIENKTVKEPSNPTKNGYAFEGWYLDNTKYNFNSKVTGNITLVAKWRQLGKYTVEFDSNGGSKVANQTVFDGNKVTKPANPTKSGVVFKEWQLNGKTYNFDNTVNGNMTLTAVWITQYTVSFNSDGGSSVVSQKINSGEKVTKPDDPTKGDYIFKEWQLNGNTYDFNSVVTENITLTAVWRNKQTFHVNFDRSPSDMNCAANCIGYTQQTVLEGGKATEPTPIQEYEGHTFKEWQVNGKKFDFNTPITSDTTITAVYTKNNYKVTVEYGNGIIKEYTKEFWYDLALVEYPLYGKTHDGWIINDSTHKDYKLGTDHINDTVYWVITSDTTIKEVYDDKPANFYTVTLDANGGTVDGKSISTISIQVYYKFKQPSDPIKEGQTFKEWQLNGKKYEFNKTPITGDITLLAVYE